jgi:bifunctional non-homologous end joining protein LigD
VPARFKKLGDLHAKIDHHAGSIEALLELFERQGMGDAPWPPHYRRQASEPPRVQPSKRKSSKRRSSKRSAPLLEIGRARRKEDALAGMERWKARHPQIAAHLQPADLLIDSMRGRYSTWTRIRINLQHVPEDLRPAQEPLDPDEKILSSS